MANTRKDTNLDVCSAADELNKTSNHVLQNVPIEPYHPKFRENSTPTRMQIYEVQQAAREYAGLI